VEVTADLVLGPVLGDAVVHFDPDLYPILGRHDLLNLTAVNPMIAVPSATTAIRGGELNHDDDITDEAKEENKEMTNTIPSKVNNDNSLPTQLAQVATGLEA